MKIKRTETYYVELTQEDIARHMAFEMVGETQAIDDLSAEVASRQLPDQYTILQDGELLLTYGDPDELALPGEAKANEDAQ